MPYAAAGTDTADRPVRVVEHTEIALADGTRLAARIWLPATADRQPVPAILEYLPYRKRDGTCARDEISLPYLAAHGYACVRVDIRGNGESDGLMWDEYTEQELADGEAVIDWIARQPWCTGRVGIWGISWGGFNGLQIAYRQPPALGAVITLCSTDDRYADDIHYMGGGLLLENLAWAGTMLTYSARPPDPALVGERWREMWLQRLDNTPLLAANWLAHQRRDDYWRHGSIAEDFSRVGVPVFAVSGWQDGYSNTPGRMMTGLAGARKALIGPWSHKYPHIAFPGPTIDFLGEALRWWDRWLKNVDTGVEADPMMTMYVEHPMKPTPSLQHRPGHWTTEPTWPSPRVATRRLALGAGTLSDTAAGDAAPRTTRCPQHLGLSGGLWSPLWAGPTFATDQREDDGLSLTFDGAELAEPLTVYGAAVAELTVTVDQPTAFLAVRLNDVHPDGTSERLSLGILNLTHREGHDRVVPLVPGEPVRVRVPLNDAAHRLMPGHRLRLAVSTAYWPLIWPSPAPVTLTLHPAQSHLELPVRPHDGGRDETTFAEATGAPGQETRALRPAHSRREIRRDVASGLVTVVQDDDLGETLMVDIDLAVGDTVTETATIHPEDPLSARHHYHRVHTMRRGDWRIRTVGRSDMWSDADRFHLDIGLDAYEGESLIWHRRWRRSIDRDGL